MNFTKVINISASPQELITRQQSRVTLAQQAGLAQRPDDNPSTYAKRLKDYFASMEAVIDYYTQHYTVADINSTQGIEQTTQAILNAMDNKSVEDVVNHSALMMN